MKKLVMGILAHVDSGKTTLSESLLYNSGKISSLGRVDHKNSYLDTNILERERGITIYNKNAVFSYNDTLFTIVDTPGHTDFATEAERSISILDYAILIVSGPDSVKNHTKTLWNMLSYYKIPTFIFVNKMDLENKGNKELILDIKNAFGDGVIDFSSFDNGFYEDLALLDSKLMDEYMETEKISDKSISTFIKICKVFPVFFGSALKNDGILNLLDSLTKFTLSNPKSNSFGAKVYKISTDEKGARLTHVKITGGTLNVKEVIKTDKWAEKVNEIRIYSGDKYESVKEVSQGDVCALTSLTMSKVGDGYGEEKTNDLSLLQSVFNYNVDIKSDININDALLIFKKLSEEDPNLNLNYNSQTQKISISLMGEIQIEILKRVLKDRFSLDVDFSDGCVVYKETIKNKVEGVGHFEPLRHYCEVHLALEPLKRGEGIKIESKCSEDVLSSNWQNLVLTRLKEKTHTGVLTNSKLTDVKITLVNGRAHQKHTEGGDFTEATYRALRQGLMMAESVLLEPYYSFIMEIPSENTGRALMDLDMMNAEFSPPEIYGETAVIKGEAPVCKISSYQKVITLYTKGRGIISFSPCGYRECTNHDEIIDSIGYDAASDVENTPDSVFCGHGTSFIVKWDEVYDYMHLDLTLKKKSTEIIKDVIPKYQKIVATDNELYEIFEKTYRKSQKQMKRDDNKQKSAKIYKSNTQFKSDNEYLLIDGYNIIYAWDYLKKISDESPDSARNIFINKLCNYSAIKNINVILVFDAYKVKDNLGTIEKINSMLDVVYTKEAQTADTYIEKTAKTLSKSYKVKVATSDHSEQLIIFGTGALRISAKDFIEDLKNTETEMQNFIQNNSF